MRRQAAFSLVELIATLMIVGILALTVAPKMMNVSDFLGAGHAAETRAVLAHARRTALAARRHVCVAVSAQQLSLTMDLRDPDGLAPHTSTAPSCPGSALGIPGQSGNLLSTPAGISFAPSVAAFYFAPDGTADQDVSIATGGETVKLWAASGAIE